LRVCNGHAFQSLEPNRFGKIRTLLLGEVRLPLLNNGATLKATRI